jgi:molecular chaperone GrpE
LFSTSAPGGEEKAAEGKRGEEESQDAKKEHTEEATEPAQDEEAHAEKGPDGESAEVDPIAASQAARDKARKDLLLALAESENLRRVRQREVENRKKSAQRKFAAEMARIATVFEKATAGLDSEDPIAEGMLLTKSAAIQSLAKHGVVPFQPEESDQFNAAQMEKLGETGDVSAGCISVLERGWLFEYGDGQDVLVRAKVKTGATVATPPTPPATGESKEKSDAPAQ